MNANAPAPPRRFIFASSNPSWGGSEELWSATAAELAAAGHKVSVIVVHDPRNPPMRQLRNLGCRVREIDRPPLVPAIAIKIFTRLMNPLIPRFRAERLRLMLAQSETPDLVVICQGDNFDGFSFANICRRLQLPYVLISQKAQEARWPHDTIFEKVRDAFRGARWSFFVSRHNLRLTQEQTALPLERASVVRNPFMVSYDKTADWPDETGGLKLASVGRIYPFDKGQDILLRVLARDHWRKRPVSLTIFGHGPHALAMKQLAEYLGLTSVTFAGFSNDVAAIWRDHHALVLPSRGEGLALVLVEAMLSGRPAIVTDVAGATEVLDDEETGFVAAAPTEDALDEAMERAWRRRKSWRAIGLRAAQSIRAKVPREPAKVFAEKLLRVAEGSTPD